MKPIWVHQSLALRPISLGTKLSLFDGTPFADPFLYCSLLGGLQYLCHTRPDICDAVNKLSQFQSNSLQLQSNSLQPHWIPLKRVLRYLRDPSDYCVVFKSPPQPPKINAFSDFDWASSIDDRKSTSGGCIFLGANLVH